jgi:hypothetical protein
MLQNRSNASLAGYFEGHHYGRRTTALIATLPLLAQLPFSAGLRHHEAAQIANRSGKPHESGRAHQQTVCPVGISTAYITDYDRAEAAHPTVQRMMVNRRETVRSVRAAVRVALDGGAAVQKLAGSHALPWITETLGALLPGFPPWSHDLGRAPARPHTPAAD